MKTPRASLQNRIVVWNARESTVLSPSPGLLRIAVGAVVVATAGLPVGIVRVNHIVAMALDARRGICRRRRCVRRHVPGAPVSRVVQLATGWRGNPQPRLPWHSAPAEDGVGRNRTPVLAGNATWLLDGGVDRIGGACAAYTSSHAANKQGCRQKNSLTHLHFTLSSVDVRHGSQRGHVLVVGQKLVLPNMALYLLPTANQHAPPDSCLQLTVPVTPLEPFSSRKVVQCCFVAKLTRLPSS